MLDYRHTRETLQTERGRGFFANTESDWTNGTQVSASGSAVDFGIYSWAKEVRVMWDVVSLSGTDHLLIQIGDLGGVETTNYTSTSIIQTASASNSATATSTAGFVVQLGSAAAVITGDYTIQLMNPATFKWIGHGKHFYGSNNIVHSVGIKSLSDFITTVRVTRTGTDTFDAGTINVLYQ